MNKVIEQIIKLWIVFKWWIVTSCSDNNFKVIYIMAWYRGTGKENHRSVFENIEYDRCIFCNNDRTEIAKETSQ